jgi:hypothetical protein
MKSILKQIIPSLSLALSFGFPAAVAAHPLTSSQIQQINSGLFRSNSQDFFREGNRQREQEIKSLQQQRLNSEKKILEIDKKLRSGLCYPEFQISPHNSDTINAARVVSVNTKVKDLCHRY